MSETRPGGEKIEWNCFAAAVGSVQVSLGVRLGGPPSCLRKMRRIFLEFSPPKTFGVGGYIPEGGVRLGLCADHLGSNYA